jgi:Tol biopolymer transport system component
VLHDVAADGRVLLARNNPQGLISVLAPGESQERDLSWQDHSSAIDLSPDGRLLLFSESGDAGGVRYGAYLRRTDGAPAVRLGEGRALALSPDGRWVATIPLDAPPRLVLLPTGPGEAKTLTSSNIVQYQGAGFFPDSRRLLVLGNEKQGGLRLFEQAIDGGEPRPILPTGVAITNATLSPDGKYLVASRPGDAPAVYPVAGGEPKPIPGIQAMDVAIRWSEDGKSLLLFRQQSPGTSELIRLDLASGRRQVERELRPADPTGVTDMGAGAVTPDGRAYAYNMRRVLSDLYIVDNLR